MTWGEAEGIQQQVLDWEPATPPDLMVLMWRIEASWSRAFPKREKQKGEKKKIYLEGGGKGKGRARQR